MRQGHSRLGIASCVVALVPGAMFLLVIADRFLRLPVNAEPSLWIIVAVTMGSPLVGIALGLTGLCQPTRSRVMALVGIVLNALFLLGMVIVATDFAHAFRPIAE